MAVSDYYKISTSQLSASVRISNISNARHIAMYLCRSILDVPFIQIGLEFGGRDHSTVINACEKIEKSLKTDDQYKKAIDELKFIGQGVQVAVFGGECTEYPEDLKHIINYPVVAIIKRNVL